MLAQIDDYFYHTYMANMIAMGASESDIPRPKLMKSVDRCNEQVMHLLRRIESPTPPDQEPDYLHGGRIAQYSHDPHNGSPD